MNEKDLIPCTVWKPISGSRKIEWRERVHYGTLFYAGLRNAHQDIRKWDNRHYVDGKPTDFSGDSHGADGSLVYQRMSLPSVCLARAYRRRDNHKAWISAFLSYPNGMGAVDDFFWEIFPDMEGDISRFDSENEMERYIKKCLVSKKWLRLYGEST